MNLMMAGIEWENAPLEIREQFALTSADIQYFYQNIKKNNNILGVILLSTCNRTEIYLSCKEGLSIDPMFFIFGVQARQVESFVFHAQGVQVVEHLMLLASGVKSQIWGEGQILTQVKSASEVARQQKNLDGVLEVLFRKAVTCGKKVRTKLALDMREHSIVYRALEVVKKHPESQKVLVIGNGEIGREMAKILAQAGYDTMITMRGYKYYTSIVPEGVLPVEYSNRYEAMEGADAVISATLSPHYTVQQREVGKLKSRPSLWIDLAVPRDIDPSLSTLEQVELFNVDSICKDIFNKNREEQERQVKEICAIYTKEFYQWYNFGHQLQNKSKFFPIFVPSYGKKVIVFGGGTIGTRRVKVLCSFGFFVTVIAPEITVELEEIIKDKKVTYQKKCFEQEDLLGFDFVIAATNQRQVNQEIGVESKSQGNWTNVVDQKESCDFYFPGILEWNGMVVGVGSNGENPKDTKEMLRKIKEVFTLESDKIAID